jgi:hypothetical protein
MCKFAPLERRVSTLFVPEVTTVSGSGVCAMVVLLIGRGTGRRRFLDVNFFSMKLSSNFSLTHDQGEIGSDSQNKKGPARIASTPGHLTWIPFGGGGAPWPTPLLINH